jgi:hypothetical protein
MQLRKKIIQQTQSSYDWNYSYCGLFAINNAVQQVDFLTPKDLEEDLAYLKQKEPEVDHGDPKYGSYSMKAFHRALSRKGYKLKNLNKIKSFQNISKSKWAKRLQHSTFSNMIIIGSVHGAEANTFHAITRIKFKNKYVLLDSDELNQWDSTEEVLNGYFEKIHALYTIEQM